MIWKEAAIEPQLARYGRAPTLGMIRACSTSRVVVMQETTLCRVALEKGEELGFYVKFDKRYHLLQTHLHNLAKTGVPWGMLFNTWGAQSFGVLCPRRSQDASILSHANKEDSWMFLFCTFPNLEKLIIMLFPNVQHTIQLRIWRNCQSINACWQQCIITGVYSLDSIVCK